MLREGRGSVRAGFGASSSAQAELHPTVESSLHGGRLITIRRPESRCLILQLLNS